MTEHEAWRLIERFNMVLPLFNQDADWEAVVLAVPIEEHDDHQKPLDMWHVEVGWRCWTNTGKPHEYGLHLAVNNPDTTVEFVHGLLERNKAHTLGQVRTFRTYEDAASVTS